MGYQNRHHTDSTREPSSAQTQPINERGGALPSPPGGPIKGVETPAVGQAVKYRGHRDVLSIELLRPRVDLRSNYLVLRLLSRCLEHGRNRLATHPYHGTTGTAVRKTVLAGRARP